MSRKLELMLRQWGDHEIRHKDYADEMGSNILDAAAGGRSDIAGHKVLCPESPKSVRQVRRAVAALPMAQRMAVEAWYCAPLRADGNPHTKSQVANSVRMTAYSFEKQLVMGRRSLSKKLL